MTGRETGFALVFSVNYSAQSEVFQKFPSSQNDSIGDPGFVKVVEIPGFPFSRE